MCAFFFFFFSFVSIIFSWSFTLCSNIWCNFSCSLPQFIQALVKERQDLSNSVLLPRANSIICLDFSSTERLEFLISSILVPKVREQSSFSVWQDWSWICKFFNLPSKSLIFS